MPICVPDYLPAINVLRQENIFVMPLSRAAHQDIRPLRLLLLNLMPKKIETETQFIRLLSNSALQIEMRFLRIGSYEPKNTPLLHLESFYCAFNDVREENFDGLIITGAPLEFVDYADVEYWQSLKEIIAWANTHVTSTLFVCWAVQAGLHLWYDFPKFLRKEKLSGVFQHQRHIPNALLTRGFDDKFYAPHSRYMDFKEDDIKRYTDLSVLASGGGIGCYLMASDDKRRVFVTGHPEYDATTLANEYYRDCSAGLTILPPANYFPDNDPSRKPDMLWRSHAALLFSNWLNYYVYQITPFDLSLMNPSKE